MKMKESFPTPAALALSTILTSCGPAQQPPVSVKAPQNATIVDLGQDAPQPNDTATTEEDEASKEASPVNPCAVDQEIPTYQSIVQAIPARLKQNYTAVAETTDQIADRLKRDADAIVLQTPRPTLTFENLCACSRKLIKETAEAKKGVDQTCNKKPLKKYKIEHAGFCEDIKEYVQRMQQSSDEVANVCKLDDPTAQREQVPHLRSEFFIWESWMNTLQAPLTSIEKLKR